MGHVYQFSLAAIEERTAIHNPASTSTRVLNDSETLQHLQDSETQWRLFPSKRITCNIGVVAHKLLDSNFTRILRDKKGAVASVNQAGECYSLSLGFGVEIHNGYQYYLYYYPDRNANYSGDVTNLVDHVLLHLPIAKRVQSKRPLRIFLCFPYWFPADEVLKAIESQVRSYEQTIDDDMPLVVFERERTVMQYSRL